MMRIHDDRITIQEVDSFEDGNYFALIDAAISPLDEAARSRGNARLIETVRSLRKELLAEEGLEMVRDCYSGESSLSEWLDLVIRRRSSNSDDLPDPDYVRRLLAGDATTTEDFLPRARGWLEARLFSKVHNSRDREAARKVIDDVISDLYGKELLEKFHGSGSLPAWLCKVGENRLYDALQKASHKREIEFPRDESGESSEDRLFTAPERPEIDETILSTLREGLSCAFSRLSPRRLFLVRLVFLHGVERQSLAALLQVHPSGIGREIKATLESVTQSLTDFMQSVDPDGTLDLSDYVFLSEHFQAALHGDK